MENSNHNTSRYLPALVSQQQHSYASPARAGIHPTPEHRIIMGFALALLGIFCIGYEVFMVVWTIIYEIRLHPGPVSDVNGVLVLAVILGLLIQVSLPLVGVFTTPSWIKIWKWFFHLFSSKAPPEGEGDIDLLQVLALVYMIFALVTSIVLVTLYVVARTTEATIISITVFFTMIGAILFVPLGWFIYTHARQELLATSMQEMPLSGNVFVAPDGTQYEVYDLPPGMEWPLGELPAPANGVADTPPREKIVESDPLIQVDE